jgi:hypothetical protein
MKKKIPLGTRQSDRVRIFERSALKTFLDVLRLFFIFSGKLLKNNSQNPPRIGPWKRALG